MKLKRQNKPSARQPKTLPNHSSNDFSSILYESPWERFIDKVRPLIKALFVMAIIGGSVYGSVLLFSGKDSNEQSTEYTSSTNYQDNDKDKLYQCLDDVAKSNPSPETSDPEFYRKLIDGYDKRLGCYDKYPGVDLASKSQVEENRKNAIDSSGAYKESYLASRGESNYSTSSDHKNPTTGCSYTLSESEYIKCTDDYNSRNSTNVSKTAPPNDTQPTPTRPTPPSRNAPSSPDPSGSSSGRGYDMSYWQRTCENMVRQSAGGTGMTQSQREKAVARCIQQNHRQSP